jgi:hypothetical protein
MLPRETAHLDAPPAHLPKNLRFSDTDNNSDTILNSNVMGIRWYLSPVDTRIVRNSWPSQSVTSSRHIVIPVQSAQKKLYISVKHSLQESPRHTLLRPFDPELGHVLPAFD